MVIESTATAVSMVPVIVWSRQEERGRCMSRCMEVLGEGRKVWPTYMEVGVGGGGGENTFQLKENEAYAVHVK